MRPDGTPDDYVPTTYHKRKIRHEIEMTGLIVKAWIIAFVVIVIALVMSFFRPVEAQEPVPFAEPCSSGTCTVYNQALVWTMTGDERTLAWAPDANDVATMALFYQLQLLEFPPKDPQVPVFTSELPEGTNLQAWTPNRAGVFFLKLRACRTDIAQDGTEPDAEQRTDGSWILCSVWAVSIDSAYTDPVVYPRGFIILAELAPATGGSIE